MSYEHIRFEVTDGVGVCTLIRPEKYNALTYESYAELVRLTHELPQRDDVKVLVLRGEGKSFCCGGDVHQIIGDLLERDVADHLKFTQMTGAVVKGLREMPQPVICEIQGLAVGAGAVIAIASDLRVLAEGARIGFIFTKVGLTGADMGAAYLLPRLIGLGRATEILMFGEMVPADEALRIGLANRVVAPGELTSTVDAMARRLADGPTLAQASTKRMLQRELDMDFHSAMEGETLAQALLLMGDDHREFYESWKEKRDPQWSGR